MKKLISILLAAIMIVSVGAVSVGAFPAPHYYGDVNCNHEVEVTDVTDIQRSLANLIELSELSKAMADVDANSEVTILDATMIQMKLAKLINKFNHEEDWTYIFVNFNNITANFESGKAMANVPVTFNVSAWSPEGEPLSYALIIDGIEVAKQSEPVFTYTFEEAGDYRVTVYAYNKYNERFMHDMGYQVIENPDSDNLIISAVNQNSFYLNEYSNIVITANAYGGTAPYEYRFELVGYDNEQDYSESNAFEIGELPMDTYTVNVYVKDADGKIANDVFEFEVEDLRPA